MTSHLNNCNKITIYKKSKISGSTLKIIASILMLIDHTAAVVFPVIFKKYNIDSFLNPSMEYLKELLYSNYAGWICVLYQIMRMGFGRLGFPIYCFLLVEGFNKTRNKSRYAFRLFIFSIISEIPFDLAFHGRIIDTAHQNVFFTLLLGFMMMWLMEITETHFSKLYAKAKSKQDKCLIITPLNITICMCAAVLAEFVHCDYSSRGIIAIAMLYFFRKNKIIQLLAGYLSFIWEPVTIFAFILIGFYNGERGMRLKWAFYIFYPAHLLILHMIAEYLQFIL